jgi:HD-like signal output (HDOD) protein
MQWHAWWRENQWAAYLEHMDLPVRAISKETLRRLEAERGEQFAAKDLEDILLGDPLLALRLLKDANQRLPRRLARDITTPLGVVLALGTDRFRELLNAAPNADESNPGFQRSEDRAILAAQVAFALGGLHVDLDSGELALSALLSNAGEIELWAFAPELPEAARAERLSGRAVRSEQAQMQACGFAFKSLTLLLIEHWNLPQLIMRLIRGDEGQRARLARLARDIARHISNGTRDAALPDDVRLAAELTHARPETVIQALPRLDEEDKLALMQAIHDNNPDPGNT